MNIRKRVEDLLYCCQNHNQYQEKIYKITGRKKNLNYLFTTQSRLLTTLRKKPLENIVGKGENAGIQHFHISPQCFLPHHRQKSSI